MRKILVVFFLFISNLLYSQSLQDLERQASSMNIRSQEDLIRELKNKGMTVQDAQRMAKLYGLDFQDYVSKYVIGEEDYDEDGFSNQMPVVSELILIEDSLNMLEEDSVDILEEIDEDSIIFFGYDIFLNNPFANKDYLVCNIDEGYILAPGDVLRIFVFGDNTYQVEVEIDLNGNILLPDIGMFFASGYTFSTIKKRLIDYLGRSFSGLLDNPQRSFLDVSLTQIRPVKVTLLGESNTPGPHLVNGFATVLNAIYSSGGIKTSGSLRNIQVFRNNKLIKNIDLYDYITKGSLDGDIRLMNNDIIFIPVRENTIELLGSVRNPAIYELKSKEGVNNLLDFSGGLNYNSSTLAIVNRIKPIKERKITDTYSRYLTSVDISTTFQNSFEYKVKKGEYLYLIAKEFNVSVGDLKKWNSLKNNHLDIGQKLKIFNSDFELFDGDVVTFSEIPDKTLNVVSIGGSINRPGKYPYDKFKDLKTLIINAGNNILPRTYLGKVDISKEMIDGSRSFKSYNLKSVLEDEIKVTLDDQDSVGIYSLDQVEGDYEIKVSGFGVEGFGMIDSIVSDTTISIKWRNNITLFDVIFSSTPFEDENFQSNFLRSRIDVKRFSDVNGMYTVNPISIEDSHDFILEPQDEVLIFSKEVFENIDKSFSISGYVNNPGEYRLDSSMTIEDAILTAGGLRDFANLDRVAVYSLDKTSELKSSELKYLKVDINYLNGNSKQSKNTYTLRNFDNISIYKDPKIKNSVTVNVVGEVNSPGTVTLEFINENMNSVIDKVGGFTANASLGSSYIIRDTVPIEFNFLKDLSKDISFLSDGDSIIIINNKDEITISGAVNNPSKILYSKKRSKYYLKNSGGKLRGRAGNKYVIYPSGKAKEIGFLRNPTIYPGSEIFVSFKDIDGKERKPFGEQFVSLFSVLTGALTTVLLIQRVSN